MKRMPVSREKLLHAPGCASYVTMVRAADFPECHHVTLDEREESHLTYESATRLLVRYAFSAGRSRYSQPQSPRAVFLPGQDALIGELTDASDCSWPAVAREFALSRV